MLAMRVRAVLRLLPAAALTACAAYAPPAPVPPTALSRDLPAPFERVWNAAMQVADTAPFQAQAVGTANGVITSDFRTDTPAAYVDCGAVESRWNVQTTPALLGLGFDAAFLEATATIGIRAEGGNRAAVRVEDRYALGVYRIDPIGTRIRIAEFRFDSGSADTRRIGLRWVTCRASRAIERRFLDQIAARL